MPGGGKGCGGFQFYSHDRLISTISDAISSQYLLGLSPLITLIAEYTRSPLIYLYSTPTLAAVQGTFTGTGLFVWNPDPENENAQPQIVGTHSEMQYNSYGGSGISREDGGPDHLAPNALEFTHRLVIVNDVLWAFGTKILCYPLAITDQQLKSYREKWRSVAVTGRHYCHTAYVPAKNAFYISGGSSVRLAYITKVALPSVEEIAAANSQQTTSGVPKVVLSKGPNYDDLNSGGRYHHASVGTGSWLILIGGYPVSTNMLRTTSASTKSVVCYDVLASDTGKPAYQIFPDLITPRAQMAATLYAPRNGSRLLVVGGGLTESVSESGGPATGSHMILDTCEVLDLNTIQTADGKSKSGGTGTIGSAAAKWRPFPKLQTGRYAFDLCSVGNRLFAIGGWTDASHWAADQTNQIKAPPETPIEVYEPPSDIVASSTDDVVSGGWRLIRTIRVKPSTKATVL